MAVYSQTSYNVTPTADSRLCRLSPPPPPGSTALFIDAFKHHLALSSLLIRRRLPSVGQRLGYPRRPHGSTTYPNTLTRPLQDASTNIDAVDKRRFPRILSAFRCPVHRRPTDRSFKSSHLIVNNFKVRLIKSAKYAQNPPNLRSS